MRRHTIIVIAVVILGVGGYFLLRPPAAAESQKIAEAAKPGEALKPAPVVITPKVAAPVVAPAPKPAETAAAPVDPATPTADPHTDLNTTIDDIANRLQSGNLYEIFMDYGPPQMISNMTPEAKAALQQQIQLAEANPESQPLVQMMVQGLLAMKGTSPSMDDTGTRATYTIPMPGTGASTIAFSFNNVGGKWYINNFPVSMEQANGTYRLRPNVRPAPNQ